MTGFVFTDADFPPNDKRPDWFYEDKPPKETLPRRMAWFTERDHRKEAARRKARNGRDGAEANTESKINSGADDQETEFSLDDMAASAEGEEDVSATRRFSFDEPSPGEAPWRCIRILASDIEPELIDWLWGGWLARSKLHILAGSPSVGKSTLAMDLAARISSGSEWPDGTRASPARVVVWSGEDEPADTLIPRLSVAGADLTMITFITGVTKGEAKRSFDPASDMPALETTITEIGGCALLIIDPVVSAAAGDSHKNSETRRGLQPLVDLGAKHRTAIIGIHHFSKGTAGRDPLERFNGSLAFGAIPRIGLVASKSPVRGAEKSARRVIMRAKSNIGPDDGGF